MNKAAFLLFIVLGFSCNLLGQKPGLNLDLFLGPVLANQTGSIEENNEDVNSKAGFHLGVTSEIKMNRQLSLAPSIQFMQKGFKTVSEHYIVSPNVARNFKSNERINYLEIPIHLLYYLTNKYSCKIYLSAGPSIGMALKWKAEIKMIDYDNNTSPSTVTVVNTTNTTYEFDEDRKRFEVSASFLVGFKIKDKYTARIFYSKGLTDTYEDNRNSVYGLSLGYSFNLSRGRK